MFLGNLTLAEFLVLFGAVAAVITIFYLLDRTRRHRVVASLEFWVAAARPTEVHRRRRIRQPLSLLLQLLAAALLIAAAGELRWGSWEDESRDHVLVIDTSAWMGASGPSGTLMEETRSQALAWLRALPAGDRVMVVRAGALVAPVTRFDSDRDVVAGAIQASEPGAAALGLSEALDFASRALALRAQRPGEIVFAGAARVAESDQEPVLAEPGRLRVLPVGDPGDNVGLRRVGLRHSETDAWLWEVYAAVRNYGSTRRDVEVAIQYTDAPMSGKQIALDPGEESEVTFALRTRAAGLLEVRLFGDEGYPGDNRAVLEVPARRATRVEVYTHQPDLLRPLVAASPFVEAVFRSPEEFGLPEAGAVVVLDGFSPENPPAGRVIWLAPPGDRSPVPVRAVTSDALVTEWRAGHPLGHGLQTQDLRLSRTEVFEEAPGWEAVASVDAGPVILATGAGAAGKIVVLGFHLGQPGLRLELAAPLLFANMLRWFDQELFRRRELQAAGVGAAEAVLDEGVAPESVRVLSEDGTPLPATVDGGRVRFFSPRPGVVRISTGESEMVYSMTLPEVPAARWEPPPQALRGIPPRTERPAASRELWRWLALIAGLILLVEWLRYGRRRIAVGSRRAP